MNTNNDKWNKPLGIILCLGVFAWLIYLSNLKQQKTEEFSQAVDQNNISEISQSTSSTSLDNSQHIIQDFKKSLKTKFHK